MFKGSTKRQPYLIFSCLLLASFLLSACATKKGVDNDEAQLDVSLHYVEGDNFNIHYAKTGNLEGPIVLFLHGTSGSWRSFSSLLQNTNLQDKFTLIAIDRLGWGNSTGKDKNSSNKPYHKIQFSVHSEAIAAVIKQENEQRSSTQPIILVGHSLGASIATRVAVDSPELVAGMLLISGTIDPELSEPRWYNRLAQFTLINVFLPNHLIHSNREVVSLHQELVQIDQKLPSLNFPITHIQGLKDGLVNPKNSLFSQKKFKHLKEDFELIEMPDAGHFILWKNPDIISSALLRLSSKSF